jgi:hypothetical protein
MRKLVFTVLALMALTFVLGAEQKVAPVQVKDANEPAVVLGFENSGSPESIEDIGLV